MRDCVGASLPTAGGLMTNRPVFLLLATTVACATTPLPAHLSITELSVGFVSDRRAANRLAGQTASSDLLFLDVEVANPDPVPRRATVICLRVDDAVHPLKHEFALRPRSRQRQRIMGFSALPVSYQVRCRIEPAHAEPGKWTEFLVPANDSTLTSPM